MYGTPCSFFDVLVMRHLVTPVSTGVSDPMSLDLDIASARLKRHATDAFELRVLLEICEPASGNRGVRFDERTV